MRSLLSVCLSASELHAPLLADLSLSACRPMCIYVLRSVFDSDRPSLHYTVHFIHSYISTGMKMSRYTRATSKNKLFYRILPIFIPTSNHNLPGRRRDRRRPPAVGWSYLSIITWSLLPPNFSPAEAIHQQSVCVSL